MTYLHTTGHFVKKWISMKCHPRLIHSTKMRSTVIAEVRKTVHVHVGKKIRWCRGIANYLKILLIQFQATFSTLYVMAIFGGKVTYYTMASTLTNQVGIYILKFDTHGFNHTKNKDFKI